MKQYLKHLKYTKGFKAPPSDIQTNSKIDRLQKEERMLRAMESIKNVLIKPLTP